MAIGTVTWGPIVLTDGTAPQPTHSTPAAGDLLILCCYTKGAAATWSASGWSTLVANNQQAGGTVAVFFKTAVGNEGTSAFTTGLTGVTTGSSGDSSGAVIAKVPGGAVATPLTGTATVENEAASQTTYVNAGVTPAVNGALICLFTGSTDCITNNETDQFSGWTGGTNVGTWTGASKGTTSGSDASVGHAHAIQSAAAATGNLTVTLQSSGGFTGVSVAFAIRPAFQGPVTGSATARVTGTGSVSGTATAVVRATRSVAGAADAVVQGSGTVEGSADAVVQAVVTATGSADTVVQSVNTVTGSADAVVDEADPVVLDLIDPDIGDTAAWPLTTAQMDAGFSIGVRVWLEDWSPDRLPQHLYDTDDQGWPSARIHAYWSAAAQVSEGVDNTHRSSHSFGYTPSSGWHEIIISYGADHNGTLYLDGVAKGTGNTGYTGFPSPAPTTFYVGVNYLLGVESQLAGAVFSRVVISSSSDWTTADPSPAATNTVEGSATAIVQATLSTTGSADAVVVAAGEHTVEGSATAIVRATLSTSGDAAAVVVERRSTTGSADAVVVEAGSHVIEGSATAVVRETRSATGSASAVVAAVPSVTGSATAIVVARGSATGSADAIVILSPTVSGDASVVVLATRTVTGSATAVVLSSTDDLAAMKIATAVRAGIVATAIRVGVTAKRVIP